MKLTNLECGQQYMFEEKKETDKYYCLRVKGHEGFHMGIQLSNLEELDLEGRLSSVVTPYGLATRFKDSTLRHGSVCKFCGEDMEDVDGIDIFHCDLCEDMFCDSCCLGELGFTRHPNG